MAGMKAAVVRVVVARKVLEMAAAAVSTDSEAGVRVVDERDLT